MVSLYKISYIDRKTTKHNTSKGAIRSLDRFWNPKILIGNGNQILLTLGHAVVARAVVLVKSQGRRHFKGASWWVLYWKPWHNNGQNALKHNNCSPKWPAIEVPVAALVMMLISHCCLSESKTTEWQCMDFSFWITWILTTTQSQQLLALVVVN